jgi:hypothetical protein
MTYDLQIDIDLDDYVPLEILLKEPDDFLRCRETLSRIGICSKREQTLYQSCHILHKKGKYYLMHFKELFALDGKTTDISETDIRRRNTIARLLEAWGLLEILNPQDCEDVVPIAQIKIIAFKEKANWTLVEKYSVGKKFNIKQE